MTTQLALTIALLTPMAPLPPRVTEGSIELMVIQIGANAPDTVITVQQKGQLYYLFYRVDRNTLIFIDGRPIAKDQMNDWANECREKNNWVKGFTGRVEYREDVALMVYLTPVRDTDHE